MACAINVNCTVAVKVLGTGVVNQSGHPTTQTQIIRQADLPGKA